MNPLRQIAEFGQEIWLDDIHRDLITSGELKRLIEEDGLCGMTSNPAIFEKAIADSDDYADEIHDLREQGKSTDELCEALMVQDVQMAADVFRELFDQTNGEHGYVSIEVNPNLARDTNATIDEAQRLWKSVNRPNIFIKVPGTREGLPAIEQLVADGINVNVTLLFGLPRYREVATAFLAGLERRVAVGLSVKRIRSVASFFLSRIDALLDPTLERFIEQRGRKAAFARSLHGQTAIASARIAYQIYEEMFSSPKWQQLATNGAQPQKLLWASTSTKDPNYSDVKYVEALIGPNTVNTLPTKTLDAYRDHGEPAPRLTHKVNDARLVLEQLPEVGLDLDQITQQLEDEGIEKFVKPYESLLETLEHEMANA